MVLKYRVDVGARHKFLQLTSIRMGLTPRSGRDAVENQRTTLQP